VVQVRVGEQYGVNLLRRYGQRRPVAQAQGLVALKETAVNQQTLLAKLDQVFRTGDGVGGAQKSDVQAHTAW
jgi:hypothetical protein